MLKKIATKINTSTIRYKLTLAYYNEITAALGKEKITTKFLKEYIKHRFHKLYQRIAATLAGEWLIEFTPIQMQQLLRDEWRDFRTYDIGLEITEDGLRVCIACGKSIMTDIVISP